MTPQISRRTVAKGAAWAAPTVAFASSAPAFAASPPDLCLDQEELGFQTVGASWSVLVGTKTSDEVKYKADGNDANLVVDGSTTDGVNSGAAWNINLGNPKWTNPPTRDVTGVKFYGDTGRQAIVRTANGISGVADVATQGITTPVVASAGLSTSITLQSDIPYKGLCPAAGNTLASVSIPVVLIWLENLQTAKVEKTCSLWLNYSFNVKPGPAGCYPLLPLASAYSLTTTPEVP